MRKGTPVVMYDGTLKVVEDVVVGDVLLGPDGGPRCVLSTNQGVGDMYEIRPNWKGKRWVVNFDHILTLVGTGSAEKNRWGEQIIDVPLREWWTWSKKKKHNFKLLRASALEFGGAAKVELPIEPYFLGVLLGDGSMQQSTPLVTTADDEIVREVHRQAKLWGLSVSKHHNDKKLCPSYGIHGGTRGGRVPNPLMAALSSLGLRGHSSDDKFIPQIYKTASMRDRREIFAGLIDTDGSRNMTGFDYVTKSKTLADDVAFVARSLGMAALVSRSMKRAQTGPIREYWRVNITGDAVTTIPCRLERKRITERRHFRNALHVGFKVVPTGTVETFYGFTLDGDSRYLLDDFTITHNSYFAQRYLRNQARLGRSVLYISVEDPQELMFCRMLADFSSPKLRPVHIRQKLADPRVVEQARLAMSAELRGLVRYVIRKKATVAEVCQIIRRHRFMVGIDSVVIDYLQAVQPNKTTNNKTQDTAFIVSELKKCFEDCGVAGWVLSQYARDGYREGAEPNIQACKYAGDIENESEIMCLLWRDDEGRLHAKLPKVKWSQAQGLRYIIDTDESGCLLDWQDDFEQPQEDQEPRRGGGKKGQQR
jgi:replicative DNA helicase